MYFSRFTSNESKFFFNFPNSLQFIIFLLQKVKDLPCRFKTLTKYISLSRNALAVVVGILICYLVSHDGWLPFRVSGEITPGLPPFKPPPFSTTVNGTTHSFGDMVSDLGASLATIPLISILETVAIAKAFCELNKIN